MKVADRAIGPFEHGLHRVFGANLLDVGAGPRVDAARQADQMAEQIQVMGRLVHQNAPTFTVPRAAPTSKGEVGVGAGPSGSHIYILYFA